MRWPLVNRPVVANAVEPVRQYVEQKAAHELANGEIHDLVLVVAILAIVLPAKTDMVVVEIEQSAVGDGDTVGVLPVGGNRQGQIPIVETADRRSVQPSFCDARRVCASRVYVRARHHRNLFLVRRMRNGLVEPFPTLMPGVNDVTCLGRAKARSED